MARTNIRKYSYQNLATNKYPNIFASQKLTRTNIRIYSYPKNDTNEYPNKYLYWKYLNIQIFEYIRHTLDQLAGTTQSQNFVTCAVALKSIDVLGLNLRVSWMVASSFGSFSRLSMDGTPPLNAVKISCNSSKGLFEQVNDDKVRCCRCGFCPTNEHILAKIHQRAFLLFVHGLKLKLASVVLRLTRQARSSRCKLYL